MARELQFGVRLTGDSRGAVRSIRRVDDSSESLRRELQRLDRQTASTRRGFQGWASSLMSVRGAIGPLAGVAGLSLVARLGQQAVTTTSALGKAAKTAGTTAETLQELRFAFGELAGVTETQVDTSLQRFQRRLGLAADDTGAAADTFGELGVSIEDAGGRMRDTETVLNETLRALANMESDSRRAAKASEVFGEEAGPRLATALQGGISGLDDAREAANDLGVVLSNETVAAAEKVDDKFNRLTSQIGTAFKTAVVTATSALADFAAEVDEQFGDADTMEQRIAGLQDNLSRLDAQLRQRGVTGPTQESLMRQHEAAVETLGVLQRFAAAQSNFTKTVIESNDEAEQLNEATGGAADNVERLSAAELPQLNPDPWKEAEKAAKGILESLDPAYGSAQTLARELAQIDAISEQLNLRRERTVALERAAMERHQDRIEGMQDVADATDSATEESRKLAHEAGIVDEAWRSAARNIQGSLADAFEDVLTGGISSFSDFGDQIVAIARRTAAEMAAAFATEQLATAANGEVGGMELKAA